MGGDMTGKSPTGEDYEIFGGGSIIGGRDCISGLAYFSGFGSLVLGFW
jgi:hypothetical protein